MDDFPDGHPVRAGRNEVVLEFTEDGRLLLHVGHRIQFSHPRAWRDIKFTADLPSGKVRIVSRMDDFPFERIDAIHREPVVERKLRNTPVSSQF